jgi:hypothetical protein
MPESNSNKPPRRYPYDARIPLDKLDTVIHTPVLSLEQLNRISVVRETLLEVDGNPMEDWISTFRKDAHPNREIAIWELIADAYRRSTAGRTFQLEAKKELFSFLLALTCGPAKEAYRCQKWKATSINDRDRAYGEYLKVNRERGNSGQTWQPIRVREKKSGGFNG